MAGDERLKLIESARIEQRFDPFAGFCFAFP